jgi:hypothetical protein
LANERKESLNAPEIERIFDKLREAEHGAIIKLGLPDSEDPVEAIIFEPNAGRPSGYEAGIFVMIPSESEKVYYLDPEASKEKGKLVLKVFPMKQKKPSDKADNDSLLSEYEDLRSAPDVMRGGGATGEACSKAKGVIDVG